MILNLIISSVGALAGVSSTASSADVSLVVASSEDFSSGPTLPGVYGITSQILEDVVVTEDESKKEEVSTRYLNPGWLKNLKENFQSLVIDQCSRKVRDAVTGNVTIDKINEHRQVRLAVLHGTIDHIYGVFGGVGRPKLCEMREIVAEMGSVYPAMFKVESGIKGYGLGGNRGVDGLANQMLDMYRGREGPRKKLETGGEAGGETGGESSAKRGKRKMRYGTNKSRFTFFLYFLIRG